MVRRILADYDAAVREFTDNARQFLFSAFLTWIGLSVHQVVFNLYLVSAGYAEDLVGRVTSAHGIGMACAALPAGWAADRFGRRAVLSTGTFLLATGLLARSLSLHEFSLWSASFVLGIGQATLTIAASPFMTENSMPFERTHLFSSHFGVVLIGGIAGNLIGGFVPGLIERSVATFAGSPLLSYRTTLMFGAVAAFLAVLPLLRIREQAPVWRDTESTAPRVRARDHARTLTLLATTFLLLGTGAGLIMPFFNLYFARRYGASAAQIGVYFSIAQIVTLAATLIGPHVARRMGKLRAIVVLQTLSLPFLVTLGFESGLAVSVVAFWMRSAFMQMSSPLLNSYSMEILPPALRARAHGIDNLCWFLGWATSSALAGWVIARFGYAYPYYVTAAFYGAATWLFGRSFKGRQPAAS